MELLYLKGLKMKKLVYCMLSLFISITITGCDETSFETASSKSELLNKSWYQINDINEKYKTHYFNERNYTIEEYASSDFQEIIDKKVIHITKFYKNQDLLDARYKGIIYTCSYCVVKEENSLIFGCEPSNKELEGCFSAYDTLYKARTNTINN